MADRLTMDKTGIEDQGNALVACSRMYNVTPEVQALWSDLFRSVAEQSAVPLEIISFPAPRPLDELWSKDNLGAVFICGWPFSLRAPKPRIIAAPVPAGDRTPRYHSVFIARRNDTGNAVPDFFNRRFAWMSVNSHSGWNAPRHHLLQFRSVNRDTLFSQMVGPLVSPRGVLEAVANDDADLTSVDSYWYDLLARYDPDLTNRLKIVGRTDHTPIPLLIASPDVDTDKVNRLREGFRNITDPALLAGLMINGFRLPEPTDYDLLNNWHKEATEAGYPRIS